MSWKICQGQAVPAALLFLSPARWRFHPPPLLAHVEHLNTAHHTPPASPGLFPPQITGSALTKKGRAWSLVPFYGMANSYAIILQCQCKNTNYRPSQAAALSRGNRLFVSASLSAHCFTKGRWTQREYSRPKEVQCRCKVHLVGIGEVTGEINCLRIKKW